MCLWSHAGLAPGHVHFVVQPAAVDVIEQHGGAYGPALQTAMFTAGDAPDADEVAAFADRARDVW